MDHNIPNAGLIPHSLERITNWNINHVVHYDLRRLDAVVTDAPVQMVQRKQQLSASSRDRWLIHCFADRWEKWFRGI